MSSGDNSTSRSSTAMSDREEIDLISDPEDEVEEAKQQLVPHEYSYSADITKNVHIIKTLMNRVDITGYNSNADGKVRMCVLARFTEDTLTKLWSCIQGNYTALLTAEHVTKHVSACWIWKEIPGIA